MSTDTPGREDDLTAEILRFELALARRDPAGIEGGLLSLLDDGFEEVGAGGRRWDAGATADLLRVPAAPELEITAFAVERLAPDVVLATYDSRATRSGGRAVRVSRASIWIRRGEGWRIRYHQGTPAESA